MRVWQRSACLPASVQMRKERRPRVPSKHRFPCKRHPTSRKSQLFICTPRHPNIRKASWSIASRSTSGNMNLNEAPESTTGGIDELYLRRAEWAGKGLRSRAGVFHGRARPGGPASASKTRDDLTQLASSTSKIYRRPFADDLGRPDWTCLWTCLWCFCTTCILRVPQASTRSGR